MDLDFRRDPHLLLDIVDQMHAGVFTVDARGRFVAWSNGAERITGYRAEDVVGKPCSILEGEYCRGFSAVTEMLNAPNPPQTLCEQECKIVARTGRELHLAGTVRIMVNDQREVTGAVGTFTDVSSIVRANERFEVLQRQTHTEVAFDQLIGQSPVMLEVKRRIRLAADSDVTVLITGESGTGKELAAKAVHALSRRSAEPFLPVNCSAIPESLLESELFGHMKGAFTGALRDQVGVFEAADQGTLFLDEIGDVAPAIQVKLLRVLQERAIQRIGEQRLRKIDVRLVTATHQNLAQSVATGKIREDFYYRIHVFEIRMPSLRERPDDIPALAEHFRQELSSSSGRGIVGFTREAMERLSAYHWPGNVRQLRNAIEHACVTASADQIGYLDLPLEVREPMRGESPASFEGWAAEELAERDRILDALRQTGGNKTKAAELLGYSRVTLWKKIARLGITS
ncbi:MAG: sigma 54-interacting transcriptional regulator [Pirellulaceae bacterium]